MIRRLSREQIERWHVCDFNAREADGWAAVSLVNGNPEQAASRRVNADEWRRRRDAAVGIRPQ